MTEFVIKNVLAEILFNNHICESLEDQEIVNFMYNALLLERLLYGEPVTIPELRKLLHDKILNFEFIKLDGEIRPARGTTMMKYVPTSQHPKGIRASSPKVATFYDLDKEDWRSVSQRSKEIVLKKDEKTGKPVVMVKDKPEGSDIAVDDTGAEMEEPITEPDEQPEVTVDGQPIDEPITSEEEPDVEVKNVKPIESKETKKEFHFVNKRTGATKDILMTPKEVIEELKKLGKGWELIDSNKFQEKEDQIMQAAKEKGDYLKAGDVRDYLNAQGENIPIEIVGEEPDGSFYARRVGGGIFKIPAHRMKNIGQKINHPANKTKPQSKDIIDRNRYKDLDSIEADEI